MGERTFMPPAPRKRFRIYMFEPNRGGCDCQVGENDKAKSGLEEQDKIGDVGVVSVKQIESALTTLSLGEKQVVRDFLDDLIEDQLELDPGFKSKIEQAKKEIAAGEYSRVRQPQPGR